MKLGWEENRHRVKRVRGNKRILSGHMSQAEIAAVLGVSHDALRSYAKDPSAAGYRRIPDDVLERLHQLTLERLTSTLEVYLVAA
jgi:predicted transcriptional regulator